MTYYLPYLGVLFYLFMAYCFFKLWLDFFLADGDMTPQERSFSGVVLVIASVLWVIVVPFAYVELLKFHKKHKEIIDLLLVLSPQKIAED